MDQSTTEAKDREEWCGNCRYFLQGQSLKGACRRFPPQFTIVIYGGLTYTDSSAKWRYPGIDNDDWCGEHRPIEAPKQAVDTRPKEFGYW